MPEVHSHGIFHGLPDLAQHDGKGYTAIVTGANGISGANMTKVLAQSPQRWKRIYALSRRPPAETERLPENVVHIAVDFLETPEVIATKLREHGVHADYAFFMSYIQPPPLPEKGLWSDVEETERVNVLMLRNFLKSLELAESIPRRFLLQTGAKHYGIHIGPTLTPMEEDDPRYLRQPNFYFPQEDVLKEWCGRHSISWNITRPGFIVGAVPEAAMNIVYGLALYAAVQKELEGKLEFPADVAAWDVEKHLSSATLIGYHAEWAILEEHTKNQTLNISDSSSFTYGKFWPILAGWYGLEYGLPEQDESSYTTVTMPYPAPPPRGFGGPGKVRLTWTLEKWASRPEVKAAWNQLKDRYSLQESKKPFGSAAGEVFGTVDADILGGWPRDISMNKSRKLGWHGFVDTHEAIMQTIEQLAALRLVPSTQPVSKSVSYHGY